MRLVRFTSGFTLIETMIVLSILAIIVAIAYPSYLDQVRKARRADAASALYDASQLLERCFTRLNSYNNGACPNPVGLSADGFYTVTVTRTASTYTLSAAPTGDQANDACGTLTLDHLGNKTPASGANRCWGT